MTKLQRKNDTCNIYAQYLSTFEWTHFCTFTTPYTLTLKSARRLMGKYHDDLKKAGKAPFFWAAEPFDCKEGYHTHALLIAPEAYQFKHLVDLWQTATGVKGKKYIDEKGVERKMHSRVELKRYNPKLGAAHYVGKYITKTGSDYDLLT
mgnify:CR=1 FL=1